MKCFLMSFIKLIYTENNPMRSLLISTKQMFIQATYCGLGAYKYVM